MAVSLKALCYAIYVSATIACLGSVPWEMLVGGKGLMLLKIVRIVHIFSILPYVLVLVVFYKIRDRLDKKKDGPWIVFFAGVLSMTISHVAGFIDFSLGLGALAMLGAIWKARVKLKEHEASGQDMPYYSLVGSAGTESSRTGGNVEMIQVAAKP